MNWSMISNKKWKKKFIQIRPRFPAVFSLNNGKTAQKNKTLQLKMEGAGKYLVITVSLLFMISGAFCIDPCKARKFPPDNYTSVDEMVSFSADTDIAAALSILSKMAMEHAGKVVVDPGHHTGEIGIKIDRLHWRQALKVILQSNGLALAELDTYFEVIDPESESEKQKENETNAIEREVRIKAVFLEADREILEETGINWSTLKNGLVNFSLGAGGADSVSEAFISGEYEAQFKKGDNYINVNTLLKVIESNDWGEIIANPQIVVKSEEKGRIQVGQDFSIQTVDYAGNTIDEFYSTGTILEVTPEVMTSENGENCIRLLVHVERSSIVPGAQSTTINKVQADSTLYLSNGEQTVIGGLYNTEKKKLRKGVPFLKDLPWWVFGLKFIFGYNRVEENSKELIILLEAELLPHVTERKTREQRENLIDGMRQEYQSIKELHR